VQCKDMILWKDIYFSNTRYLSMLCPEPIALGAPYEVTRQQPWRGRPPSDRAGLSYEAAQSRDPDTSK
jgi:hypothetical protein